jgi:hypothetical protein
VLVDALKPRHDDDGRPLRGASWTLEASIALMRAFVNALSVRTLIWWPRKLLALIPCAWMAIAMSALVDLLAGRRERVHLARVGDRRHLGSRGGAGDRSRPTWR